MSELTGLFKARYKLVGRDWVRRLNPDDLSVLVDAGLKAAQHGHLGGQARAQTGHRDMRGRWVRELTREEREAQEERMLQEHQEYCDDPISWLPIEDTSPEQMMDEDIAWFRKYCPQV